jgi:raffinose/stachyose/melibiose transport system substrate-binding protein
MRNLIVILVLAGLAVTGCSQAATPTAAPTGAPTTAPTDAPASATAPALSGTVRVLIHQNPPFVSFMDDFNATFQANHPGVTVDMEVVNANDLMPKTQSRLQANDVDVIDMFAFDKGVQPYMKNVVAPAWQDLIDAGLLMDITSQPFVQNYDAASIADAGSYNGKVYGVNLGRVGYSGLYYNKDLFTQNNVTVPTTWSELVAACETFAAANIGCMTAGGKDGWPIFVGAYGLLGATYPDQAGLVQGLWDGSIKYTDDKYVQLLEKYKIYDGQMIEAGASGVAADGAPGRFVSGEVAMQAGGTWYAAAIDSLDPTFEWGYIPFPGSDTASENKFMFGKYDQGWSIAADSPNKEAALAYLTEFSAPANYQAFVDAVGPIPTQASATLNSTLGTEIAPYLATFKIGFENLWVAPKGAGQYAAPMFVNMFPPIGTFTDAAAAAAAAQADLDAGLNAAQ